MKQLSLLIAATLAASSFAASAAGQEPPLRPSGPSEAYVVAGGPPAVKGAGLCTAMLAGGKGGMKFAEDGNPSIEPDGPQDVYRGFGEVGYGDPHCAPDA